MNICKLRTIDKHFTLLLVLVPFFCPNQIGSQTLILKFILNSTSVVLRKITQVNCNLEFMRVQYCVLRTIGSYSLSRLGRLLEVSAYKFQIICITVGFINYCLSY
jgi:hypothetical protein